MKYGVIAHSPDLLPYVVPVSEPTGAAAMDIYRSGSLITPMFVIDFDLGKIYRVFEDESGFSLVENTEQKLGKNTKRNPDMQAAPMEANHDS